MRTPTVALACLSLAAAAWAQDSEREATLTIEPSGLYMFEADLDDAGEYSVGRLGLGLTWDTPIGEASSLALGLRVERSEYDFTGATGLSPGGEPIDGATTYGVTARYSAPMDGWRLLTGLSLEFSGEDGADFGEGILFGGFLAGSWQASDDLTLTLGVSARNQLEDDVRVIPFVGVEWRIDEQLRLTSLEAGRVLGGTPGAGLGLVYEASDDLELLIGAAFNGREYRLDEDGPIPDGVFRDDRVLAGVAATYRPNAAVEASLGVGAVVWSNLETLDAGGSEIGDVDGDPAPFIAARVRILF